MTSSLLERELLLALREADLDRREADLQRRESITRFARARAAVRRAFGPGVGPSHWDLVWEFPLRSLD